MEEKRRKEKGRCRHRHVSGLLYYAYILNERLNLLCKCNSGENIGLKNITKLVVEI